MQLGLLGPRRALSGLRGYVLSPVRPQSICLERYQAAGYTPGAVSRITVKACKFTVEYCKEIAAHANIKAEINKRDDRARVHKAATAKKKKTGSPSKKANFLPGERSVRARGRGTAALVITVRRLRH